MLVAYFVKQIYRLKASANFRYLAGLVSRLVQDLLAPEGDR